MPATNHHDERVLVLAPLGRDGPVTAELLRKRGLAADVCADAADAARQMATGAGAVVVTEEALEQAGVSELFAQLQSQPPWSELPLIILTSGGESRRRRLLDLAAQVAGAVTLLERPLGVTTFAGNIEVALHSRRRQYQVRDLLDQKRQQTAALRASEGRLQQALGVSHSFTFEWEPVTDKMLRSASCGPILGLTGDEAVNDTGQRYFQSIHPDDRARFVPLVSGLTPANASYSTEYRVIRPDGSVVMLEEIGQASFDAAGKLAGLVGVATDITARKHAEVALAQTTETLETLLATAPLGFCHFDRELRFLRINDRLAEMNGIPAADHLGKTVVEILPELLSAAQEVAGRILATGQAVVGHEISGATPARPGVTLWWSESWYPVRDASGAITGFGVIVEDITARKRAEEKLQRLNRTLQALINSSRALIHATNEASYLQEICRIIIVDCEQMMVWVGLAENDDAKTVQPTASAGFEAGYLDTLQITWADTERGRGPTGTAIRTGQVCQCRNMQTDPQFAPWRAEAITRGFGSSVALPLLADGKPFGTLTIYSKVPDGFDEDEVKLLTELVGDFAYGITTLRLRKAHAIAEESIRQLNANLEQRVQARTAELAAANKELEAFCYSVAHDLRTPLRGIDGFSRALLEDYQDKLDAAGQDFLSRVRGDCQTMGNLIDNLLKLSRLSRAAMIHEPVDLTATAQKIAGELRRLAPSRDIEFRIADGMTALGDPDLLRVVLQNLLENAWKFTGRRAQVAVVEMGVVAALVPSAPVVGLGNGRDGARPSTAPVFFVRDNGSGFDMAYADKLFAPFQRLHSTADFPGTGIGLATVQRIIARHGGQIWVEAEVNKGATFYFTLQPKGD